MSPGSIIQAGNPQYEEMLIKFYMAWNSNKNNTFWEELITFS
jgi:hypothetical protein